MAGYVNPLPFNPTPERIDQGVDFAGAGDILAIGDAIIEEINGGGWPGGPYMSYRLTSGPDSGKSVYIAENIRPSVQPGQHVKAGQHIATMFNGGTGIEMGWADASGRAPESQTPEAGGISGANLPADSATAIGKNFEDLLVSLGVRKAPNFASPTSGNVPANFGGQNAPIQGAGGLFDISGLVDAINPKTDGVSLWDDIGRIVTAFTWFFNPSNWVRIIAGLMAVAILAMGATTLYQAAAK